MSYILSTDITAAGGDSLLVLTCGDGNGGVDSDAVTSVLEDTDADIDSVLGGAFDVPDTAPYDKIIKKCAKTIAKYYCYERKPEFFRSDGENPMSKQYDRAMTTLREIRDGYRTLASKSTKPQSSLTQVAVYGSNSDNRFIIVDDESDGNTGGF